LPSKSSWKTGGVANAGSVLSTFTPGAARSTLALPRLEKLARASLGVVAATQTTFGRV
jgi:hypothetical protein